ncbi:MAG: hypothetical protein FWH12_08075 [Treponema sp.]|nr:hypothetical protein [Treponema sp.]
MRKLTEAECQTALDGGDFAGDLLSVPGAAVILTQSWCPQWAAMKTFLPAVEKALPEARIYFIEYDIEAWEKISNQDFMDFKEKVFNNREIPYIRYYQNGVFSKDSNFISEDGFKSRLTGN